jgi:hypothetical protein
VVQHRDLQVSLTGRYSDHAECVAIRRRLSALGSIHRLRHTLQLRTVSVVVLTRLLAVSALVAVAGCGPVRPDPWEAARATRATQAIDALGATLDQAQQQAGDVEQACSAFVAVLPVASPALVGCRARAANFRAQVAAVRATIPPPGTNVSPTSLADAIEPLRSIGYRTASSCIDAGRVVAAFPARRTSPADWAAATTELELRCERFSHTQATLRAPIDRWEQQNDAAWLAAGLALALTPAPEPAPVGSLLNPLVIHVNE